MGFNLRENNYDNENKKVRKICDKFNLIIKRYEYGWFEY